MKIFIEPKVIFIVTWSIGVNPQENQYTHWMAACRLASKGKTMADSSYENEVQSIQAFLNMQHPAQAPTMAPRNTDFKPEDIVAPRFLKKLRLKQVRESRSRSSTDDVKAQNIQCSHY